MTKRQTRSIGRTQSAAPLATMGPRTILLIVLMMLPLAGCSTRPAPIRMQASGGWQWQQIAGRLIKTDHYLIHTTVNDDDALRRFARVIEAAYAQYQQLVPGFAVSAEPLKVYYFARHDEWAAYTIATTGADADAYLSVFNGGYALRDEFVCWLGNEPDTLVTAAHEGLHQFIARNFRRRLPPTLEEGLATTYENITVGTETVAFNPAQNPRRQAALRAAIDGRFLIPLDTLIMLHAGDLRDRDTALKEGYYGQAWALAVMLREKPAYRMAFLEMMKATATGNQFLDVGPADGSQIYHPANVRPVLQRYVAPDWATFEKDYLATVHELAAKPSNDPQP